MNHVVFVVSGRRGSEGRDVGSRHGAVKSSVVYGRGKVEGR